jgi:hypothetical protein
LVGPRCALVADSLDEDYDLRNNLAALGPAALKELHEMLSLPQERRDDLLRSAVGKPSLRDLSTLIAMASSDRSIERRLSRAIRDVTEGRHGNVD